MTERPRQLLALVWALVAACCLSYSAFYQAPVNDEFGHLYAGLRYWQAGDTSLFNVNPPLLRSMAALPGHLTGLQAVVPPHVATRNSRYTRSEFAMGRKLFIEDPPRFQQALCLGRMLVVAVTLAGGALLFHWARQLVAREFGTNDFAAWFAGIMAAGLWLSQPQVLAHGALITGDVFCAVCMLATLWTLKWALDKLTAARAIVLGAMLGVSILAKFTGMVLGPLVLFAFAWNADRYTSRRLFGCLAVVVGAVLLVLPIPYGFRGMGKDLSDYTFVSQSFTDLRMQAQSWSQWVVGPLGFEGGKLSIPIPLPDEFVLGLDRQQLDFETGLPSYAAGIRASHGWWWFYGYSMLVKLPLGTWLSIAVAATWLVVGGPSARAGLGLPLLLVGMMLVATAAQDGFAQQHRYILPAYPPLFLCVAVATGRALRSMGWEKWLGYISAGGLALTLIAAASVAPHWLSAFNWLAGGNTSGYQCLFNDASDWGQDTYRVKNWIEDHQDGKSSVYVRSAFSGHQELAAVGAKFEELPQTIAQTTRPCWIIVSKSDLAMFPDLAQKVDVLRVDQKIGGTHFVYRLDESTLTNAK